MKVSLASCAELYAEHRRTASPRKRAQIAAELQRRHDEWNGGEILWRTVVGYKFERPPRAFSFFSAETLVVPIRKLIPRFEFALWLPMNGASREAATCTVRPAQVAGEISGGIS
jgi:hypothetical protein